MDVVELRRAELARHRENRARLAQTYALYKSTGQGSLQFPGRFDFGLTFTEEPRMHYGALIDIDDLGDKLNIDPDDTPHLPHCTGIVADWETNEYGYWVGAYLAARVSFPIEDLVPPTLSVIVEHHFTFSGVAMKDVPTTLRD